LREYILNILYFKFAPEEVTQLKFSLEVGKYYEDGIQDWNAETQIFEIIFSLGGVKCALYFFFLTKVFPMGFFCKVFNDNEAQYLLMNIQGGVL